MRQVPWIIIANNTHKRCHLFHEALNKISPNSTVHFVDWFDLLTKKTSLADFSDELTFLRIDSTGQNFLVEKELLRLGIEDVGELDNSAIDHLTYRKGEILCPKQWFAGFQKTFQKLNILLQSKPNWQLMQHPFAVLNLFDKRVTHSLLQSNNLPVPTTLLAQDSESLLQQMREQNIRQCYVKLAYGSSAAGIICVYQRNEGSFFGITTILKRKNLYFNTRRLEKVQNEKLHHLINFVLQQGAQIEVGIPKASLDRLPFDMRVLVINQKISHCIIRQSQKPMTNLHLGGKRGNFELFKETFPKALWESAQQSCLEASSLFQCFHIGWDLLFQANQESYSLLEGNAFGDLFPGISFKGHSTYEWEIIQWLEANDRKDTQV